MKPVASLIFSAITMLLAIVVALALFGVVIDILRCVVVGTVAALGGTYLYRRLTQRYIPTPKQIIDQTSAQSAPVDSSAQIAGQIEERKKRLGQ